MFRRQAQIGEEVNWPYEAWLWAPRGLLTSGENPRPRGWIVFNRALLRDKGLVSALYGAFFIGTGLYSQRITNHNTLVLERTVSLVQKNFLHLSPSPRCSKLLVTLFLKHSKPASRSLYLFSLKCSFSNILMASLPHFVQVFAQRDLPFFYQWLFLSPALFTIPAFITTWRYQYFSLDICLMFLSHWKYKRNFVLFTTVSPMPEIAPGP